MEFNRMLGGDKVVHLTMMHVVLDVVNHLMLATLNRMLKVGGIQLGVFLNKMVEIENLKIVFVCARSAMLNLDKTALRQSQ